MKKAMAVSAVLRDYQFYTTDDATVANRVRTNYGAIARDCSNALHSVCSFIKQNIESVVDMGIKVSGIGADKAIAERVFETFGLTTEAGNQLNIHFASYDGQKNEKSIFAQFNPIEISTIRNQFNAFIKGSSDAELITISKCLGVFLNSMVAGETYGDVSVTANHIAVYIGRYDVNGTPFDAVIELHRK